MTTNPVILCQSDAHVDLTWAWTLLCSAVSTYSMPLLGKKPTGTCHPRLLPGTLAVSAQHPIVLQRGRWQELADRQGVQRCHAQPCAEEKTGPTEGQGLCWSKGRAETRLQTCQLPWEGLSPGWATCLPPPARLAQKLTLLEAKDHSAVHAQACHCSHVSGERGLISALQASKTHTAVWLGHACRHHVSGHPCAQSLNLRTQGSLRCLGPTPSEAGGRMCASSIFCKRWEETTRLIDTMGTQDGNSSHLRCGTWGQCCGTVS